MRKKKDDRFNTSVPDLIAQIRDIKARFLAHPALPLPWPSFVPTPEHLDEDLKRLEQAFEALGDRDIPAIATLNRARKELKTSFGKVGRFVEMVLRDDKTSREWPGFDLSRHPGEKRPPQTPRAKARTMPDTGTR